MSPKNEEILKKYQYVRDSKSFSPIPGHDLNEVLGVIREEWDANYKVDWYCGSCVMRMIEFAYSRFKQ